MDLFFIILSLILICLLYFCFEKFQFKDGFILFLILYTLEFILCDYKIFLLSSNIHLFVSLLLIFFIISVGFSFVATFIYYLIYILCTIILYKKYYILKIIPGRFVLFFILGFIITILFYIFLGLKLPLIVFDFF